MVSIPEPQQALTMDSALRGATLSDTDVTAPETTAAPGHEAD